MGETILLVDYGPRSIERISALLRGAGYVTEVATNGDAGIRAFERLSPDLTLVQDLLPGRPGFEVCRRLKRTPLGRGLPVLMIASAVRERSPELRESDCDGYVEKPFEDETLRAAVRRWLPATSPGPKRVAEPDLLVETALELFESLEVGSNVAPGCVPVDWTEADVAEALDAILPTVQTEPRRPADLSASTPTVSCEVPPAPAVATKRVAAKRRSRRKPRRRSLRGSRRPPTRTRRAKPASRPARSKHRKAATRRRIAAAETLRTAPDANRDRGEHPARTGPPADPAAAAGPARRREARVAPAARRKVATRRPRK